MTISMKPTTFRIDRNKDQHLLNLTLDYRDLSNAVNNLLDKWTEVAVEGKAIFYADSNEAEAMRIAAERLLDAANGTYDELMLEEEDA